MQRDVRPDGEERRARAPATIHAPVRRQQTRSRQPARRRAHAAASSAWAVARPRRTRRRPPQLRRRSRLRRSARASSTATRSADVHSRSRCETTRTVRASASRRSRHAMPLLAAGSRWAVGSSRMTSGASLQQGPGDGEPLALAAAQPEAAFADRRVEAARQAVDERRRAPARRRRRRGASASSRRAARGGCCRRSCRGTGAALGHPGDLRPPGRRGRCVAAVGRPDPDRRRRRLDEPQQQADAGSTCRRRSRRRGPAVAPAGIVRSMPATAGRRDRDRRRDPVERMSPAGRRASGADRQRAGRCRDRAASRR